MEININDIQNKIKIDDEIHNLIKDVIMKAELIENIKGNYEVNITITDNEYIKEINKIPEM